MSNPENINCNFLEEKNKPLYYHYLSLFVDQLLPIVIANYNKKIAICGNKAIEYYLNLPNINYYREICYQLYLDPAINQIKKQTIIELAILFNKLFKLNKIYSKMYNIIINTINYIISYIRFIEYKDDDKDIFISDDNAVYIQLKYEIKDFDTFNKEIMDEKTFEKLLFDTNFAILKDKYCANETRNTIIDKKSTFIIKIKICELIDLPDYQLKLGTFKEITIKFPIRCINIEKNITDQYHAFIHILNLDIVLIDLFVRYHQTLNVTDDNNGKLLAHIQKILVLSELPELLKNFNLVILFYGDNKKSLDKLNTRKKTYYSIQITPQKKNDSLSLFSNKHILNDFISLLLESFKKLDQSDFIDTIESTQQFEDNLAHLVLSIETMKSKPSNYTITIEKIESYIKNNSPNVRIFYQMIIGININPYNLLAGNRYKLGIFLTATHKNNLLTTLEYTTLEYYILRIHIPNNVTDSFCYIQNNADILISKDAIIYVKNISYSYINIKGIYQRYWIIDVELETKQQTLLSMFNNLFQSNTILEVTPSHDMDSLPMQHLQPLTSNSLVKTNIIKSQILTEPNEQTQFNTTTSYEPGNTVQIIKKELIDEPVFNHFITSDDYTKSRKTNFKEKYDLTKLPPLAPKKHVIFNTNGQTVIGGANKLNMRFKNLTKLFD